MTIIAIVLSKNKCKWANACIYCVLRGGLEGRDLTMFWTAVFALLQLNAISSKKNLHTEPYLLKVGYVAKTWDLNKKRCVDAMSKI